MTLLRQTVRRIGVPGVFTWLLLIGTYLWVRVPDGSWRWSDLVKYTALVLIVSLVIGDSRERQPHVLCTSCGKKNIDPKTSDLSGWRCGYCDKDTLVRVGVWKSS